MKGAKSEDSPETVNLSASWQLKSDSGGAQAEEGKC
jgi:hypothetical protein